MIIQYLLSLSLCGVFLYGLSRRSRSGVVTVLLVLTTVAGCVLVWIPELANDIARVLGVGRGADLIFYCWIVISLAISLNLHFKTRTQAQMIVELARTIALQNAVRPLEHTRDSGVDHNEQPPSA